MYVHATVPELALPGMPAPRDASPADHPFLDEGDAPVVDLAGPEEPPAVDPARSESMLWPDWPIGPQVAAGPDGTPGPEWVPGPEWPAGPQGMAEPEGMDAAGVTGGSEGAWDLPRVGDGLPAESDEPSWEAVGQGGADDVPWTVSAYQEQTYEGYDEQAYEGYTYSHDGQPGPRDAGEPDPDPEPDLSPVPLSSVDADGSLEPLPPDGREEERGIAAIARGDLIAELAGRLELLDQLLGRLEEAKRQAADASEHLLLTRRWQEETVRTIQEERARMRQRQHALDELAERARAAVEAMQATYRTLPREVIELAIELQVLDRAGFITRRAPRPPS
ncbi:hypothetical protein [Pseudofrankia asymbiotica]|uniref:hypothetical protein n=1 Tax=Pseudofrankia asymbiotica TaxID=1834516 RepID=UPI00269EDD89